MQQYMIVGVIQNVVVKTPTRMWEERPSCATVQSMNKHPMEIYSMLPHRTLAHIHMVLLVYSDQGTRASDERIIDWLPSRNLPWSR